MIFSQIQKRMKEFSLFGKVKKIRVLDSIECSQEQLYEMMVLQQRKALTKLRRQIQKRTNQLIQEKVDIRTNSSIAKLQSLIQFKNSDIFDTHIPFQSTFSCNFLSKIALIDYQGQQFEPEQQCDPLHFKETKKQFNTQQTTPQKNLIKLQDPIPPPQRDNTIQNPFLSKNYSPTLSLSKVLKLQSKPHDQPHNPSSHANPFYQMNSDYIYKTPQPMKQIPCDMYSRGNIFFCKNTQSGGLFSDEIPLTKTSQRKQRKKKNQVRVE